MFIGRYRLSNPILALVRPKLIILDDDHEVQGQLKILKKNFPLYVMKTTQEFTYFMFHIDIIEVVMVVKWFDKDAIDGFFDTPIGHFRFKGKKL